MCLDVCGAATYVVKTRIEMQHKVERDMKGDEAHKNQTDEVKYVRVEKEGSQERAGI